MPRHRRIRKIGEPIVPLPQSYVKGVVFIGRDRPGKPSRISATGFLVTVDTPVMAHPYVVTAAHAVEGSDQTFVQLADNEGVYNMNVPEWIVHGKHDVAVAPIEIDSDDDVVFTGLDQFIDEPDALGDRFGPIELGDPVYFLGLLGKIPAMVQDNIPIVRTGFLGALWQEDVPVKRTPHDETKFITAHLIDCRSFAGFSGSPCYLQKERVSVHPGNPPTIGMEWRTLLFGLIGGHFDDWTGTQRADVIGEENTYSVSDDILAPVSTGVGYVIPAEYIRETLMREELVQMRDVDEDAAEAMKRREDERNAAVEDSMPLGDESEFDRFDSLG